VKAAYPIEAQLEKLQGEVVLKIVVSETGDVESAEVVSGHPELAKAAVDAVKKWKFQPFIRNSKPVKASVKLPFDFAFSDKVIVDETSKEMSAPPEAKNTPNSNASEPKSTPTGSPEAPKRIRVSSGVTQGLVLRKVAPVYPEGPG
jgi:TonB family protein